MFAQDGEPLQGMTSDHLFPILENERDSEMFGQVGALLATSTIPSEVLEGLRLGRMTALRKPDGGVRGITVGAHPPDVDGRRS